MIISITSLLSFFFLLAVSSAVYFLSKKIRIPYTVALVAVGLLLVPLSQTSLFSFIKEFALTPELLFYVFLPVLIFESAYAMNIRKVSENIWSISTLSIISLLISAFVVAVALFFVSKLFGFDMPFIVALLFGSLISATDPVAVLALFKEFGAPRRLSLIFEGESLFNDGTAVALFLIVLDIALHGFEGFSTILEGLLTFSSMVVGGIVVGLIFGGIFSKLIEKTRSNEFVSITLTMVMAHTSFILSELISEHLVLYGTQIRISPIIATTLAAMVLGNYGRYKFSPLAENYIEKFWGNAAFIVNSVIFLLIGLIFASLPISIGAFAIPTVITAIIVAVGRALSIYTVVPVINFLKLEDYIPKSWQALLSWGSLRGALAVTMVFLIPDDINILNWDHPYSPKELILALTIGCIFVTLFLKATSVGPIIRRLKLDTFTDLEKVEENHSSQIIYAGALRHLLKMHANGYTDHKIYGKIKEELVLQKAISLKKAESMEKSNRKELSNRLARIYALGIERHYLKDLFSFGELNERVYKRIFGKLTIQMEKAEKGEVETNLSKYRDRKDVFENLFDVVRNVGRFFFELNDEEKFNDRLEYYRAQSIIARKVVKEMSELKTENTSDVFSPQIIDEIISLYKSYQEGSKVKLDKVIAENPVLAHKINERLARSSLKRLEEEKLEFLNHREMVTPKLFITLIDKMKAESETN